VVHAVNFTIQQSSRRGCYGGGLRGHAGSNSRAREGGLRLNQLTVDKLALGRSSSSLWTTRSFGILSGASTTSRQVSRAQLLRPFPQFDASARCFRRRRLHLHALQNSFSKRLSHGLQLAGHYTWSKSIDNGESYQDAYNIRADRSITTRHHPPLAVSVIYALPFGRGKAIGGNVNRFLTCWSRLADGRLFPM